MKPSFVAYIDESGDEEFVFNDDGSGSTRWFVLSAAVIRQVNDLQMVSCLKAVREVLRKEPKTPLHFVDLKHEQRVPYIRRIGELPMRTVSVLEYKPLIAEPEKFQNTKYLLYRYATRLLLERVFARAYWEWRAGAAIFSHAAVHSSHRFEMRLWRRLPMAAATRHSVR